MWPPGVIVVDEALLAELRGLALRDSETRARLLREDRLYGGYDDDMQRVHRENAVALARIVAERGWPGSALVGPDGCRVAWLIAQHAICTPDLQRGFLRALEGAAKSGDAPIRQVAMLTDRIRFNEGRPQVYGTVLDWDEGGELGCELEDPAQVDARRAAAGLPPFEEALGEHRRQVAAEGGRPPADFRAYKDAAMLWARKVGWR